jgi:hypothetical protein
MLIIEIFDKPIFAIFGMPVIEDFVYTARSRLLKIFPD